MVFILLFTVFLTIGTSTEEPNERPIIGILAQETSVTLTRKYPGYRSYIAASYVKAVEGSGARVVPIFIGQNETYYREIIHSINGVLLPGGAIWFKSKEGYATSGKKIMQIIEEINNSGTHFPVLGICLGFELLLYIDNGMEEYRTNCWSKDISLSLKFSSHFEDSKLYQEAPRELLKILTTENVTYNEHMFCVTEKNMTEYKLDQKWKVLSLNEDPSNNIEFVSSVESIQYPIAGIQFHPEKNSYEWKAAKKFPHSYNAVISGRYFFDWLIIQARLNSNHFADKKRERQELIFNYPKTHTGEKNLTYDEVYFFK